MPIFPDRYRCLSAHQDLRFLRQQIRPRRHCRPRCRHDVLVRGFSRGGAGVLRCGARMCAGVLRCLLGCCGAGLGCVVRGWDAVVWSWGAVVLWCGAGMLLFGVGLLWCGPEMCGAVCGRGGRERKCGFSTNTTYLDSFH